MEGVLQMAQKGRNNKSSRYIGQDPRKGEEE